MSAEMYSLEQVERVFEVATRRHVAFLSSFRSVANPAEVEGLRDRFLELGPWVADKRFTVAEVVAGLTHAFHVQQWGLWFDHQEAFLVSERCNALIDRRVGRPDSFWADPDSYTSFQWEGDQVADGLLAFDEWLVADRAAHNEREQLTGLPLRLVEVNTGFDYLLSILCHEEHVDEAIEALAAVGVRSRQQTNSQPWT